MEGAGLHLPHVLGHGDRPGEPDLAAELPQQLGLVTRPSCRLHPRSSSSSTISLTSSSSLFRTLRPARGVPWRLLTCTYTTCPSYYSRTPSIPSTPKHLPHPAWPDFTEEAQRSGGGSGAEQRRAQPAQHLKEDQP